VKRNLIKKKILYNLLLIRLIEEKIVSEYSYGLIRCPVHLSIGQESSAVGVCLNLNKSDQIVNSHRCHATYIAKGGNIKKMISEIYGNPNGTSSGKAGSMHLFDKEAGILASVPIVGSSIPLAAGSALQSKILNKKNISVAFFGDGAAEEGILHETLNISSIYNLPILFVCEDNNYSCYTKKNERQSNNMLEKISSIHNIEMSVINSKDTMKIYDLSKKIIKKIRRKMRPHFLLIKTFRRYEHCGPLIDDHLGYRSKHEIKEIIKNCPVKFFINKIINSKILTLTEIDNFILKKKIIINDIFDKAKKYKHNKKIKKKLFSIFK
jgi:TPP-dependent pyruvate/acetoin dehydrogenase alpha subunit